MFKHQKIMLITALALTSFGGPTTAHAATWHKGTPKALRGDWSWQRKHIDYAGGGGQYGGYTFTKSGYVYQAQGDAPILTERVRYQNLGHGIYKIRAYRFVKAYKTKGAWKTITMPISMISI